MLSARLLGRVTCSRGLSTSSFLSKEGLVVGVYTSKKDENSDKKQSLQEDLPVKGTALFEEVDGKAKNVISKILKQGNPLKSGEARKFYGVVPDYSIVSVVGLGQEDVPCNPIECMDEKNENIRLGISAGVQSMYDCGIEKLTVDATERPTASAEGTVLASWKYKEADRKKFPASIIPWCNSQSWEEGKTLAESQNFARFLMECPSNLMTPTIFSENVSKEFEKTGNVTVEVFDEAWAESENMNAFLSVAKGSTEPLKFVKISYNSGNTDDKPLVMVGKGVTFDSGGISIKPSAKMEEMRGDMGGAATVASSILAVAKMKLPVNVIGLIPLCENMPSGHATKPGDVVTARDGTTVQIDNTDAEGRLILADAISYAHELDPSAIVDVATLTGGIIVALGGVASGVFSNDNRLWEQLEQASATTGDRVWRMPLFDFYSKQMKPSHLADINNIGGNAHGSACTAAAFLRHFVKPDMKWMHLDIAGSALLSNKECTYVPNGFSGRPTRTLAEFIRNYKTV